MHRLTSMLPSALAAVLTSSCTILVSKWNKPLPEVPEGATVAQVHQLLGAPEATQKYSPPLPLGKDPSLHAKGAALSLRNDRRPTALRESFVLHGRYRKASDPDGTDGLAEMSAKMYWLPEIFLGPCATLQYFANSHHKARFVVWYSPEGREIFHTAK